MESNYYFNQKEFSRMYDTENESFDADAFNTIFSVGSEPFRRYGICLSLLKIETLSITLYYFIPGSVPG